MLHDLGLESMSWEGLEGQTGPGAARALAGSQVLRQTRREGRSASALNASAAEGVQVMTTADRPTVPSTVA